MVSTESEQLQFPVGSEVEVTSDEEGFKGAWYRAKVLESAPKSSSSKKKKKVLVEYTNLVTEDTLEPLREHVDLVHIRPLPPQKANQRLEVNDVIDAFYQDGWWTGVIQRVLDNFKYLVFFENPPDVIEFESENLRPHLKWVDGKWVPSEKQQTTSSIFSPGTPVEVSIDKDNSRGAWFPATFIKEIEENIFLVKLKNQSPKSDSEPGFPKVAVDSNHIRPTPPRYVDRSYELLEKVDAFYDSGWRAGLITKVLAEGRYLVFFKHANKDKELGKSEVRPPVEWIDGKWVTDSKEVLVAADCQEQLGQSHECNSTDIPEVLFQLESSGSATGRIEEKTSSNTNSRKDLMELRTPRNEISLSQAFTPSTKKLKLTVSNGNATRSQPSKKLKGNAAEPPLTVTACNLREMVFKISTKEAVCGLATLGTGGPGNRSLKRPLVGDQLSTKTESPSREKHTPTKQRKVDELDNRTTDIGRRMGGRTKRMPVKYTRTPEAGKEENTASVGAEKEGIKNGAAFVLGLESPGRKGSDNENHGQLSNDELLKPLKDQKKPSTDPAGNKSTEIKQQRGGASSQKRKRGRPRKLVIISPRASAAGNSSNGVGDLTDEMLGKDCVPNGDSQDAPREKVGEVAETSCISKDIEMATATTRTVVDDDQPLSTWFGGIHNPASVDASSKQLGESRLSPGRAVNQRDEVTETPVESPAVDTISNGVHGEIQRLPFVKSSPVWETIESMEVFRVMPQNPHFRPLDECQEEYREGSAIGNMITFANLVEKTSKLQFDDPRRIFDSTLETLLHLEKHGFEVKSLRARVNALLSIKDSQQQLQDESKGAESKIMQHTDESAKFGNEMDEIMKKISELQEKHALIKSEKENVDREIARLRLRVGSMKESIQNAHVDFKKVVDAPWKSA